MNNLEIYEDIANRTDGDIYVGVVGPVRTGKSTFIKNFMDLLVIPNIENSYKKERARDELPQSAARKNNNDNWTKICTIQHVSKYFRSHNNNLSVSVDRGVPG